MSREQIVQALRVTVDYLAEHADDISARRKTNTPYFLRNIAEWLKWYADDLETVIDLETVRL
jgi:hypothetical protein